MALPTRQEVISYIRDAAAKRGIDPDVAVAVAEAEGLNSSAGAAGAWQSDVVKGGVREKSYGPFQLYTSGGLGNAFQKATGLDPSDPANWAATVDYALDAAAKGGWGPWYGAARVGISKWEGLRGAKGLGSYSASTGVNGTRGLQQALAAAGFNPGKIDGIMGPRTREAVKAFQKANGLTVDGKVGPQTMAALGKTSVQTAGNRSFRSVPGIGIAPTAFRSGNFLPAPEVSRFQRDTASMGTGKVSGGKGSYQYAGAYGEVNPQLVAAVQAASAALGKSITITSALDRPGASQRNSTSQHMVGKGGKGLGNAFDLSMEGWTDQEKALVAQTLAAHGVARMGTYDNHPNMLHIDMKNMGKSGVHFMHNKFNHNMAKAPGWFRSLQAAGLSIGKPSNQQIQVATNVVNQIAEGLKSGKNGIAYASLSPKNAPAGRSFFDTPRAGMPEQMSEGFSTSGFQPAETAALFQRAKEQAAAVREAKAAQAARERGMDFGAAYAPRADNPVPTYGATTDNVQGTAGSGGMALNNPAGMNFGAAYGARQEASAPIPTGMDFAAAYGRREAPVPVPTPAPRPTPAPAPARQAAVPRSATTMFGSPPTMAQVQADIAATPGALNQTPIARQKELSFKPGWGGITFNPDDPVPSPNVKTVQTQKLGPDAIPAIPGVTGPPLGRLNSAPGHVTPESVEDQYGVGPGWTSPGFDGQAGTPAPQREVLGWDINRGGYHPLSPSQLAAYDALGGDTGAEYSAGIYNSNRGFNPLGMFSGLSSMLGGGAQSAGSGFSPMAGIMGLFNGGGASGANPGQEYGQPGYNAMMADPTVKASTEAILGRPLDGSTRYSTLDPNTGLPVAQEEAQMPAFHMGRIFGAPGAPAAGLNFGNLLGKGIGQFVPGQLGSILGGLLSGRGIDVGGLVGGLASGLGPFGGILGNVAQSALGQLGRGIAPMGGGSPSALSGRANMGVVTTRDANGRVSYNWGPTGGGLSQGAANAGWANNNPERSYGGYGGGIDPTPN